MRCRVQRFRIIGRAASAKLARVTWTAAFLAAAPAMAAEVSMPVKASWLPPVVQPYDWTGLYVGAHLGYAGGRSSWSAPPDLASSLDLDQSSDIFTGSGSYFGGLQIGYDYMLANRVVLGAQLDASFPGFPRNHISIGGESIFSTPDIGLASYRENVLHSGTLRGRVGYAPANWLVYATGGFAWAYNPPTLTALAAHPTQSPVPVRGRWGGGVGGGAWRRVRVRAELVGERRVLVHAIRQPQRDVPRRGAAVHIRFFPAAGARRAELSLRRRRDERKRRLDRVAHTRTGPGE